MYSKKGGEMILSFILGTGQLNVVRVAVPFIVSR